MVSNEWDCDHYPPWSRTALLHSAVETMAAGYPFGIRISLYGSGVACWKTHYRRRSTVGSWTLAIV